MHCTIIYNRYIYGIEIKIKFFDILKAQAHKILIYEKSF